jgi:cobalt/nickel transport system ATP-binding protein
MVVKRNKVSIATVMCRKPEFFSFDEPTIGQDRKQQQILEEIIQKASALGKTIIIVSHDTEFIYNNTKRVIIFEKGQILADGPTNEVLSNSDVLEKSSVLEPQIIQLVKLIKNQFNSME